jgi:ketosteroid isomerase-like protein
VRAPPTQAATPRQPQLQSERRGFDSSTRVEQHDWLRPACIRVRIAPAVESPLAETATPAERLTDAYRIWADSKGCDSEHWIELIDDNVEMHSVLKEELPDDLAAKRHSTVGVREYFQTIARDWEMVNFDVKRIVDGGDDVVMVGHCAWRNRTTGMLVDTPKVDVWRFRDGRAISFLEMFDSLAFMRATPVGLALA